MRQVCEICRGARVIRLPVHRPLSTTFEATAVAEEVETSVRVFPCPECAPTTSPDRVQIVEHHFQADTRYEDKEGYRRALVGNACASIAGLMEKSGLIRMQRGPDSDRFGAPVRQYRATVGIVTPQVVANLDEARERAEESFAQKVIELAQKEIDLWRSHYGDIQILKRDAKRLVGDALDQAKSLRPTTSSWGRRG